MPEIPQVRRLMFNDEEIGMGFNSESGLAVGTVLEDFEVQANPTAPGGEVFSDITIINSHEELMESLGMSFGAQGRYGFFSASVKAQFSESTRYNSMSTFVIAKVVVQDAFKRGRDFRVTPEGEALLDTNRQDEFKKAFGDSFVRGLQTGGEYYCVIRVTSVSTATQENLSAKVHGAFQGFVTSAEVNVEFEKASKSESTRAEHRATMYQKAGIGTQLSPVITIDEALTRFREFPKIVQLSPAAYETEVATYDTLPLPLPTPEEQEAFLFALRDAREKKLHFIQTRNDLEFALRNPIFFRDLPSNDVLSNAISDYTRLINGVTDHAIGVSRGQIKPPRVFDPSVLSPPLAEPAPIPLQRIAPPTIRVPDLLGIDNEDLLFAFQSFGVGATIDEIIAGTVFGDPGEQGFHPNDISREGLEFLQLEGSEQVLLNQETFDAVTASVHMIVSAQFPSADTMIVPGSQVILQWVAV